MSSGPRQRIVDTEVAKHIDSDASKEIDAENAAVQLVRRVVSVVADDVVADSKLDQCLTHR